MAEVREVMLPGVGVRHDFVSETGELIGVLVHHDGRREMLVYDRDDLDACSSVVSLSERDARTVSELLGGSQVTKEIIEAQHEIDGQRIDWITVEAGSPMASRSIGEGELRSRTGASVIAVIRNEASLPAPGPDFVLNEGDVLVSVGSGDALDQLRSLLQSA